MIGQATGFEESAAGFLERVVQALPRGALVRAERVIGPAAGEWGEDGLPDRLTGRGEPAVQQPGRVWQPVQGHLGGAPAATVPRPGSGRPGPGGPGSADPTTAPCAGPPRGHAPTAWFRPQVRARRDRRLGWLRWCRRSPPHAPDRSHHRRKPRPPLGKPAPASHRSTPAGPEPLHRLRPPPRLHPGTANLRGDQIRQPAKPKMARHVPRVQLGQHRQLPELHPAKLRLQLAQLSKQLRIETEPAARSHVRFYCPAKPSTTYVQEIHINKGETVTRKRNSDSTKAPPRRAFAFSCGTFARRGIYPEPRRR